MVYWLERFYQGVLEYHSSPNISFCINLMIITLREYGSRFNVHRDSLAMWPMLPIASNPAHSNSLIVYKFEDNNTLLRIFLFSVPQLQEH